MSESDVVTVVYGELLKVAGGATVVLAALATFLGKVAATRIANRETRDREAAITELKAHFDRQAAELKAHLDVGVQRTVLVDKLQFEHEYEIYRKAWETLFMLQQVTLALRPVLDHVDNKESEEDRMRRRIGDVRVPYNDFSKLVESNEPFYPAKVYAALVAVRDKCREEINYYEFTDRPHREYWEEARKNREEILALIGASCEAIRNRISEVRVA